MSSLHYRQRVELLGLLSPAAVTLDNLGKGNLVSFRSFLQLVSFVLFLSLLSFIYFLSLNAPPVQRQQNTLPLDSSNSVLGTLVPFLLCVICFRKEAQHSRELFLYS